MCGIAKGISFFTTMMLSPNSELLISVAPVESTARYRYTHLPLTRPIAKSVETLGVFAITAGMTEPTSAQDLFKGRHFDQEIIVLCIRWYLTFKLSSRDLVQMMAERGIALAHTTILRWV
jgi:hypothetical protein